MVDYLKDLTTLRVGGPIAQMRVASSRAEAVDIVRDCDRRGETVVIIGDGSNLVAPDAGVAGTVLLMSTRGIQVSDDTCGGAWVEVEAGESWDGLVRRAIEDEWSGIEALSGIPGRIGATPLQNVGAYGQEVAQVIARVTTYDRVTGQEVVWPVGDCEFAYRSSRFKRLAPRYVVLSVTFQFKRGDLSGPVEYPELAQALGIDVGSRASAAQVREHVLQLRRTKGMVLDKDDRDTWSVGSFFTNPIVTPPMLARMPGEAPQWSLADGRTKLSAAWLVENAGFSKGFSLTSPARAAISSKHALALTNQGGASAGDILALARTISQGVFDAFGVWLAPEPSLMGASL